MNGTTSTSEPGWLDDALAINAIAMAWWRQTHPVSTATGTVSVSTPAGGAAIEISPLLMVLLIGIVLFVVLK